MNGTAHFSFRLYVAGDGQNSARAIANLTALCLDRLRGRHEIEVIDVFGAPDHTHVGRNQTSRRERKPKNN